MFGVAGIATGGDWDHLPGLSIVDAKKKPTSQESALRPLHALQDPWSRCFDSYLSG
jgi:hypothetical protein